MSEVCRKMRSTLGRVSGAAIEGASGCTNALVFAEASAPSLRVQSAAHWSLTYLGKGVR